MDRLCANIAASSPPRTYLPQCHCLKLRKSLPLKPSSISHSSLKQLSLSISVIPFLAPLPSLAEETISTQSPEKLTLESVLVSIDDFFTRYPFFVATCAFIWLVVIPLTEEYFRKFKFVSVIDAFRRMKDGSESQLLDVRDGKSISALPTPDLKSLNKVAARVEFKEDEASFVQNVVKKFPNPNNTILYIIDDFDGDSLRAAEILFKNGGFKAAYALKDGIRGKNGWLAIQDTLLPTAVHILAEEEKNIINGVSTEESENEERNEKSS